jgi:hypothetical protein
MLQSRSTSPSSRCYQHGRKTGCYTTGWQDHVELSPHVEHHLARDRAALTARIQRLWRQHARAMPTFLPKGHTHGTWEENGGDLFMITECSTGGPEWDHRRGQRLRLGKGCFLFSIVGEL